MAVHFPKLERRQQMYEEFRADITNWMILPEKGDIKGELPKFAPEKLVDGKTKTQRRFENRRDGKHRAPRHNRVGGRAHPVPRPENCSTCGKIPAPILFGSNSAGSGARGQYCGPKCIPLGANCKCYGPNEAR